MAAARAPLGAVAVAALVVAIFMPAAAAQGPAPAPTSDGTCSRSRRRPPNPSLGLLALRSARRESVLVPVLSIRAALRGTSIDLGIAYVLMLVALVLTYLIHPLDASSPYKLF
ncbi:arabinogalactan peptide 16-like [Panicum miliaceum]|uniref:Arabinogalactan peptide 16-like n=1 Tax=Panicum miliaceum TaxID=4540 RepID=A0A3L6RQR8_PANMI|nr:arabinogalactan peptide 16-like [Panicum miliaceum]